MWCSYITVELQEENINISRYYNNPAMYEQANAIASQERPKKIREAHGVVEKNETHAPQGLQRGRSSRNLRTSGAVAPQRLP